MRGYLGLSVDVRPGYQKVTVCCRISADAPPDALKELWEHAQRISPVLDTIRTCRRFRSCLTEMDERGSKSQMRSFILPQKIACGSLNQR